MNKIKFSHRYEKLPLYLKGTHYLLSVQDVDLARLPASFLEYDTLYFAYFQGFVEKHYPLEQGKYLLLVFFNSLYKKLFTTLRPYNPQKAEYYRSKLNEEFEIVVEEEKNNGLE